MSAFNTIIVNNLRFIENHDGVVLSILLCVCLYLLMIFYLRAEENIKEFYLSTLEETNNINASWLVVSFCYVLLLSNLLVAFVPFVPSFIIKYQIQGYGLSRFGFVFLSLSVFYLFKTCCGYLYYLSIGCAERWETFSFVATKYYFSISILLSFLLIGFYFYPLDHVLFFKGILILAAILFVFKLVFYHFHSTNFLPQVWYYKILYICTLQIAPLFAIWKLLFY